MPDTPTAPPAIQIQDPKRLEQEVTRILQAVDEADGSLQTARDEVKAGRKLLNVEQDYPNKPYDGASTAIVPVAADTKAQIRARVVEALSSGDVFAQFSPESLEDREDAEATERMVQACCEQWMDFRRKVLMPMVDACLRDESSFGYVGWELKQTRKRRWKVVREYDPYGTGEWLTAEAMQAQGIPVVPSQEGPSGWGEVVSHPGGLDGNVYVEQPTQSAFFTADGPIQPSDPAVRERWVPEDVSEILYDGPKITTLRFEELGWYPTDQVTLADAPIVYYKLNLSGRTIREMVASGYYDKVAVFETKDGQPSLPEHPGDTVDPVRENSPGGDSTGNRPFDTRNYNLIVAHAPYVERDGGEPIDTVFVIHKPTRLCLHAAPNEWWDQDRHIVHMRPFPEPDSMRGDSIPKNEGPYQDPMTRLMRAMVVAAEYGANPPKIYEAGSLTAKEKDKLGNLAPGEYCGLNGDPNKGIAPWRPGLQADTLVVPLQTMDHFRQRKFGISDTRSGALNPTNRTAQEVRAALLEGSVLLQDAVTSCGSAVADICRLLQHELYQKLDRESVQRLWLLVNPPKALEFPEGEEPSPEEMDALREQAKAEALKNAERALGKKYVVTAAGSTEAANPELLAARYTQYIAVMAQLAAAEPALEGANLNTYELHRRAVNVYRQGDPAKLLGNEKDWKQRLAQGKQIAALQAQIAQMEAQLKQASEQSKIDLNAARAEKTRAEAAQIDSATQQHPVDALQKLANAAQMLQPQAPQGEGTW